MANEPAQGSRIIAGVAPLKDVNQEYVPLRVVVDDSYDPPRMLVHGLGTFNQGLTGIYTQSFEYSSGLLIYEGWAVPGSSKAAAVWAIRKLTYSGTDLTDIQWADGAATFDNIWNNRAALSYS